MKSSIWGSSLLKNGTLQVVLGVWLACYLIACPERQIVPEGNVDTSVNEADPSSSPITDEPLEIFDPSDDSSTNESATGEPDEPSEDTSASEDPGEATESNDEPANPDDPEMPTPPHFIESISPRYGEVSGNTLVQIFGVGFSPESTVWFGEEEAPSVLFQSAQHLNVRTPPQAAGRLDVVVRTPTNTSTSLEALAENAFEYFEEFHIDEVVPNQSDVLSGEVVEFLGRGLTSDLRIWVGDYEVLDLDVDASGNSAAGRLPAARGSGRVDVLATQASGRELLQKGFTWTSTLALDSLVPNQIVEGHVWVELYGAGFTPSTIVQVNGAMLPSQMLGTTTLVVNVSTLSPGVYDVVVSDSASEDELLGALTVVATSDDLTGGEGLPISLNRYRFNSRGDRVCVNVNESITAVMIDDSALSSADSFDEARCFRSTAQVPGVYTLRVNTLSETYEFEIEFVDQLGPGFINPTEAPAGSSVPIEIHGAGFASGDHFWVGVDEVENLVFDSAELVRGTLPAGQFGVLDLRYQPVGSLAKRTVRSAFTFSRELSIDSVAPTRGSIAGGDHVLVTGHGFSSDTRVDFGGSFGANIQLRSESLLSVQSPSAPAGTVSLRVRDVQTQDESSLESAYEFFDPTSLLGGPRGGSMEGRLYVTILDAATRLPVQGVRVELGDVSPSDFVALSDIRGHVTFNDPSLVGPLSVNIRKEGYMSSVYHQVDARELTMFMVPLVNPVPPVASLGSGETQEIVPPVISGRVFGFDKSLFDPGSFAVDENGNAIEFPVVQVTTTAPSSLSQNPIVESSALVYEDGGVFVIRGSRTGRLGLVALAGIYNLRTNEFRPRQLGFRRNVTPNFNVELDDQDIVLSIDLDLETEVSLADAQMRSDALSNMGPTVAAFQSILDFGDEGSFRLPLEVSGTTRVATPYLPDLPGEVLTFFGGVFTTDGANARSESGSVSTLEGAREVSGTNTLWNVRNEDGSAAFSGAIFVTQNAAGLRFAARIVDVLDDTTLLLNRPLPFDLLDASYHIGDLGAPYAQIVQNASGSLSGGVTLQPNMGFITRRAPGEAELLAPTHELEWDLPLGQAPSAQLVRVTNVISGSIAMTLYLDGDVTKVRLPLGDVGGDNGNLPPGTYRWTHELIFVPGFDWNAHTTLDFDTRARRSWSFDSGTFVIGGSRQE